MLDAAEREVDGEALAAFDAPLGVPASFLTATGAWTFVEWLEALPADQHALEPVRSPAEWSVARPFFRVPHGTGGRTSFESRAREDGIDLFRAIDRETSANSVFAFDLPGQVAPAAQALWLEVAAERGRGRSFSIWPFEPPRPTEPVVAEIYPRAAYAIALARELPARPLAVAKRNRTVREEAVRRLAASGWVARQDVRLADLDSARTYEDDFDALMTAAALIRLLLEERSLAARIDGVAEGAILGTGSSYRGAPIRVEPIVPPRPGEQRPIDRLAARLRTARFVVSAASSPDELDMRDPDGLEWRVTRLPPRD